MTKCCLFSRYIYDIQTEVTSKMDSKIYHKSHRCLQLTVFLTSEDIRVSYEE